MALLMVWLGSRHRQVLTEPSCLTRLTTVSTRLLAPQPLLAFRPTPFHRASISRAPASQREHDAVVHEQEPHVGQG